MQRAYTRPRKVPRPLDDHRRAPPLAATSAIQTPHQAVENNAWMQARRQSVGRTSMMEGPSDTRASFALWSDPLCILAGGARALMLAKSPTSIVTIVSLLPCSSCSACSAGEPRLRTVATTLTPAASSCAQPATAGQHHQGRLVGDATLERGGGVSRSYARGPCQPRSVQ